MRILKKKRHYKFGTKLLKAEIKAKKRFSEQKIEKVKSLNLKSTEKNVIIPLEAYQLFRLGLFMGHSQKFSVFLGTWCVQG
jgi:hypothetical protein